MSRQSLRAKSEISAALGGGRGGSLLRSLADDEPQTEEELDKELAELQAEIDKMNAEEDRIKEDEKELASALEQEMEEIEGLDEEMLDTIENELSEDDDSDEKIQEDEAAIEALLAEDQSAFDKINASDEYDSKVPTEEQQQALVDRASQAQKECDDARAKIKADNEKILGVGESEIAPLEQIEQDCCYAHYANSNCKPKFDPKECKDKMIALNNNEHQKDAAIDKDMDAAQAEADDKCSEAQFLAQEAKDLGLRSQSKTHKALAYQAALAQIECDDARAQIKADNEKILEVGSEEIAPLEQIEQDCCYAHYANSNCKPKFDPKECKDKMIALNNNEHQKDAAIDKNMEAAQAEADDKCSDARSKTDELTSAAQASCNNIQGGNGSALRVEAVKYCPGVDELHALIDDAIEAIRSGEAGDWQFGGYDEEKDIKVKQDEQAIEDLLEEDGQMLDKLNEEDDIEAMEELLDEDQAQFDKLNEEDDIDAMDELLNEDQAMLDKLNEQDDIDAMDELLNEDQAQFDKLKEEDDIDAMDELLKEDQAQFDKLNQEDSEGDGEDLIDEAEDDLKDAQEECTKVKESIPDGFALKVDTPEELNAVNMGCCLGPYADDPNCQAAIPQIECDVHRVCTKVDILAFELADSLSNHIKATEQKCRDGAAGILEEKPDEVPDNEEDLNIIRIKCCLAPFDADLVDCEDDAKVEKMRTENRCDLLEWCLEATRLEELMNEDAESSLDQPVWPQLGRDEDDEGYFSSPHVGVRGKEFDKTGKKKEFDKTKELLSGNTRPKKDPFGIAGEDSSGAGAWGSTGTWVGLSVGVLAAALLVLLIYRTGKHRRRKAGSNIARDTRFTRRQMPSHNSLAWDDAEVGEHSVDLDDDSSFTPALAALYGEKNLP